MLCSLSLSLSLSVTLLYSNMPEVKYVALRNVLLLIQKRPDILQDEMKVRRHQGRVLTWIWMDGCVSVYKCMHGCMSVLRC
jgi:hypothetical protein